VVDDFLGGRWVVGSARQPIKNPPIVGLKGVLV
jgi:hypothetical protein